MANDHANDRDVQRARNHTDVLLRKYAKQLRDAGALPPTLEDGAEELRKYLESKSEAGNSEGKSKKKRTSAAAMAWRAFRNAYPYRQDARASYEAAKKGDAKKFAELHQRDLHQNPDYFMSLLVRASFGQRIRHVVAEYGASDDDAATVLRTSRQTVQNYYAGRGKMVEEVSRFMRLCEAYDAHPATVLGVMTPDTAELVDLYESCDATTRAQIIEAAKGIAKGAGQPRRPYQPWDDYTAEQVTELCERLGIDPAEL